MAILFGALLAWFVVNAAFVAFMVRASRAERHELERPVVEVGVGAPGRSVGPVERAFGGAAFGQEPAMGELQAGR